MFLLNSSRSRFYVIFFNSVLTHQKMFFLPKLQNNFAEFLNINSLKHLSNIYQSIWVDLGNGFMFDFLHEHIASSIWIGIIKIQYEASVINYKITKKIIFCKYNLIAKGLKHFTLNFKQSHFVRVFTRAIRGRFYLL